jgi:hypothetical protein
MPPATAPLSCPAVSLFRGAFFWRYLVSVRSEHLAPGTVSAVARLLSPLNPDARAGFSCRSPPESLASTTSGRMDNLLKAHSWAATRVRTFANMPRPICRPGPWQCQTPDNRRLRGRGGTFAVSRTTLALFLCPSHRFEMDWHIQYRRGGREQLAMFPSPEAAIENACRLIDDGHDVFGIGTCRLNRQSCSGVFLKARAFSSHSVR